MCCNEKWILDLRSREVNGVQGMEDIVHIQLKAFTAVNHLQLCLRVILPQQRLKPT